MNPDFFDNNFLATDANLIFLSKILLKAQLIFFFIFYAISEKMCHRVEVSTIYQLLFFTIPYLYLNRAWLCDSCKVLQPYTKPKNVDTKLRYHSVFVFIY